MIDFRVGDKVRVIDSVVAKRYGKFVGHIESVDESDTDWYFVRRDCSGEPGELEPFRSNELMHVFKVGDLVYHSYHDSIMTIIELYGWFVVAIDMNGRKITFGSTLLQRVRP